MERAIRDWGSRLHFQFTPDDVSRIRIAPGVNVMWEVVLSVQRLQNRSGEHVYDRWRALVRSRLLGGPGLVAARYLSRLAPDGYYFPDFLTPSADDLDEGIDRVVSTAPRIVARDLDIMARYEPVPSWMTALAEHDQRPRRVLAELLHTYYRTVLEPDLDPAAGRVAVDRRERMAALADGGVEAMFSTFPRYTMEWHQTDLWIPIGLKQPTEPRTELNGRGLSLVPSLFCWRHATFLADANLPPTVVFPVGVPAADEPERTEPLTRLLGAVRAATLLEVRGHASTTELADRLGVAQSTVSYHVGALRDSGLIESERQDGVLHHHPTRLGWDLIYGGSQL